MFRFHLDAIAITHLKISGRWDKKMCWDEWIQWVCHPLFTRCFLSSCFNYICRNGKKCKIQWFSNEITATVSFRISADKMVIPSFSTKRNLYSAHLVVDILFCLHCYWVRITVVVVVICTSVCTFDVNARLKQSLMKDVRAWF